jgi:hypothetical protein
MSGNYVDKVLEYVSNRSSMPDYSGWCAIFKGKLCNCEPEIEERVAVQKEQQHQ